MAARSRIVNHESPVKRAHALTNKTHIGWRPDPELRARWLAFLKAQPPINRTEYLNQMLAFYLDQAERYGLDPLTLRPKLPRKK